MGGGADLWSLPSRQGADGVRKPPSGTGQGTGSTHPSGARGRPCMSAEMDTDACEHVQCLSLSHWLHPEIMTRGVTLAGETRSLAEVFSHDPR